MKDIIFKLTLIIISSFALLSCNDGIVIPPKADFGFSFERTGETTAKAGEPFFLILKDYASGEFKVFFNGKDSVSTYSSVGSKASNDLSVADSLELNYSTAGTYELTLLVTSTGNNGELIETDTITRILEVVDERCTFTEFKINGMTGIITDNTVDGLVTGKQIEFSVPDATTDFNFIPLFSTNSPIAKVIVMNGADSIYQKTAINSNDFNPSNSPVEYIVRSASGKETKYLIKFKTFVSSSAKLLTKFVLKQVVGKGNGEIGVIDEVNKTITVAANYGSALGNLNLIIESSYVSEIFMIGSQLGTKPYVTPKVDATYAYNIKDDITAIKVVAQDKSEQTYTLTVTQGLPVETFVLAGLVPQPSGVIDHAAKTITIDVLNGTDLTKLTPKWTGSLGRVSAKSGGIFKDQINGTSIINLTNPTDYKFYSGSSYVTYKITVILK